MFVFGAVGGSVTGQADIFYIMIAQGLALPAIMVLGLNIWTTADNGLYSCGLGLSQYHRILQKENGTCQRHDWNRSFCLVIL